MSSINTTTLELMYYCNMFRLRRVIVRLITYEPLIHYTLYSIIYVSFALGIPYALHCASRKPGFIIYLDKSILCTAVGVIIAAIVRPTRTFRQGGDVFLCTVYSYAFLFVLSLLSIGAVLCYFLWFS